MSTAKTAAATARASDSAVMLPRIESRILVVRDQKVIIDADLALLYGVPTKALNQAVKRNAERFPGDFMFQLTPAEKAEVVTSCDHLAKLKFSKSLPYAFTEHGATQAANVLTSARAVEMGIYVVRAFVRLKQASALHADLAKRLAELEDKTEALAMNHDTFSRNTRNQLREVFDALRELMTPPDPPKRPIGFINPRTRGRRLRVGQKACAEAEGLDSLERLRLEAWPPSPQTESLPVALPFAQKNDFTRSRELASNTGWSDLATKGSNLAIRFRDGEFYLPPRHLQRHD